ncbi:MAG: FeoB-associated Cys-rich membrane protein [bacterium]
MAFTDILLMALIIAGAVYLLYRSVWKKKGHCPGCNSGTCKKWES